MAHDRAMPSRTLALADLESRARSLTTAMSDLEREVRAPILLAATSLPKGFGQFAASAIMTGGMRFLEIRFDESAMTHSVVSVVDGRALCGGVDIGSTIAPQAQGRRRAATRPGSWTAPLVARDRFVRPGSVVLPLAGPLVDRHQALRTVADHAAWLATTASLYAGRYAILAQDLAVTRQVMAAADSATAGYALAA